MNILKTVVATFCALIGVPMLYLGIVGWIHTDSSKRGLDWCLSLVGIGALLTAASYFLFKG